MYAFSVPHLGTIWGQGCVGTSTWHRSPETEAWKRVRELYGDLSPAPAAVTSRIVAATEPETRAAMNDAAVATCLGTLVEGVQRVERDGFPVLMGDIDAGAEPVAVQLASRLRGHAERSIVEQGLASRFGDLALDAIATTALALTAPAEDEQHVPELPLPIVADNIARHGRTGHLHGIASLFVRHDLDTVFRYFVSRDLPDFIGGEGLPSVTEADELQDGVKAHLRRVCEKLDLSGHEPLLAEVIDLSPRERVRHLSPVMADGIAQGLDLLGGEDA